MSAEQIPIQNIYFLLCYAWNHLQETEYAEVRSEGCDKLWDLLAHVLVRSSQQLVKRGLHRDYVARQELRAKPKGKILFGEEIRRPPGGRLLKTCEFDDLDPDVLPNQIIHSALYLLQQHRGLDPKHRSELSEATKYWKTFARPPLSSRLFKRVQVHRNMQHYRFALKVCELIFQESIPDQETGAHRFRDFLRDEARMGDLFEQFVRNFFAREQSVYRVSRPEVKWNVEEGRSTPLGLKLLPSMNTDIVLERDGDRVIVDCKFYRDAFQRFHDTPKFISDHLYQLFAYLKNQSAVLGWEGVRGMLLYPAVGVPVDEQVAVDGHEIRIVSVNLGQEWQGVSGDLLRLLKVESPPAAMPAPWQSLCAIGTHPDKDCCLAPHQAAAARARAWERQE